MTQSRTGSQERRRALGARLEEILEQPLTGELRRLSSGASRETLAFDASALGPLVVQIERGSQKLNEAPAQAPLLAAAAEAGVPVARVLAHGEGDEVLGASWIVMQALEGTADPREILGGESGPDPLALLDEIAGALAAVHRMPADPPLAAEVEDPLALLREWYERLGEPHPTFELAFRTLAGDRPQAGPRTLVHGDFRMGNLMVAPRGLTGVLDWELTHLGDPVEDLGWLCVPAWRFSRHDRPAAGLGTREQLLAAYARHSGRAVDDSALRWWELAGTLRWGVICVMQAFAHLSGSINSIEHAVIGRRACEVEWDLLELLDPAPGGAGPVAGAADALSPGASERPEASVLHDRPTASELLEAARSAVGDDVLPGLEGRAAFQARVTLRALGIVVRELAHADEHAVLRADALSSLGVGSEAELAQAIRRGAFDTDRAELFAVLRALVYAKLQVANPRYVGQTQIEEARKTQKEGQ